MRINALWPCLLSILCVGFAHAESNLVFMQETETAHRIILSDAAGNNPKQISDEKFWALYPDISSDGRYVSYSFGTGANALGIVIQDLQSNVIEEWTPQNGLYLHSDLSGDGRFLAFSGPVGPEKAQRVALIDLVAERAKGPAERIGNRDIYRPKLDIIDSKQAAYFPVLSSSADFMIYQISAGTVKYLVRLDLTTRKEILVTSADGYSMAPTLSFDDRYLAYPSRVGGVWDLYLKDLHTQTEKKLTQTSYEDYAPTFRADGSLVFAANPKGNFQLFEMKKEELQNATFRVNPLREYDGSLYAPAATGDISYKQKLAPSIPEPGRSSFGAIEHKGKIYVVGGHIGPEHTYPPESFSARVDIFDLATQKWQEAAPLSLARHGFSLAAYGKYIYAFGGFTYSAQHLPKWKSVDLIERYDTENNLWEVVANLSKPRSSNVVAQVGDKVYLVGGWNSTPRFENDREGVFHDSIDVFDLGSEVVGTLAVKIPNPLRRALASVVVGDEIILVGGLGQGSSHFELLDNVTALNTKTMQWRELPKLPFATFAPATGIINNSLYVFGGMFKTGEMDYVYVNHIYKLDLDNKEGWSNLGRYVSETKGFSQVVELPDYSLGILGGHTYKGEQDMPVATFEIFGKK